MAKLFCFVYITTPNLKVARAIAQSLVKERLAACANILPQMHSVYEWRGRLHTDKECVLLLKTRTTLFKKVEARVQALHPFENPCVVSISLNKGSKSYLQWMAEQTKS